MAAFHLDVETFTAVRREVAPLALAHWAETEQPLYGPHAESPVNQDSYLALERASALHMVTVRQGGALCGYAAFCLHENIHMPGVVTAQALAFYLAPAARADGFLALRVLRFAEAGLKARGVGGIAYSSPASRPCHALYRRLGARPVETAWYKEL